MSRVNPQPKFSKVEHGARPGPASSYEMRQWEKVAIAELFLTEEAGAERLQTFTDLMCNGMDVDTQCSGLDMLRHSLTNFFHTMQMHGMHSPSVRWLAATDNDMQVQKVLLELAKAEDGKSSCVFEDVLHCIDPDYLALFQSMMAHPSSNVSERVAANQNIIDICIANCSLVFPASRQADCLVHGRECPVNAAFDPKSDALKVNVTSTPCVAWSRAGKREGCCSQTELVHHAWLGQRAQKASSGIEHLYFHENVLWGRCGHCEKCVFRFSFNV